jgi:multiple sugar transport system permease protein
MPRVPGRALFRILTMPPWIVPMAIGIFMWGWMYNGQFGMISGLLQNFGITDGPVAFLGLRQHRLLGDHHHRCLDRRAAGDDLHPGRDPVDPEGPLRGRLDRWRQPLDRFRRITLPLIVPAIITMSMLSLIATFNSFDIIWILTQGGPSGETTTMIIDTYRPPSAPRNTARAPRAPW